MKTDLLYKYFLEFTFIDRKEHRKKADEGFCGKIYKNIIWVYGKHGVGKSYFINHIIADVPDENVVHVEFNKPKKNTNYPIDSLIKSNG